MLKMEFLMMMMLILMRMMVVLSRMVISFLGLHEYCGEKRAMGPFVTIAHVIAHCSVTVFM